MLIPKSYPVLVEAIEEGIKLGYARAHKHTDSPELHQLIECLIDSTILSMTERFSINDDS